MGEGSARAGPLEGKLSTSRLKYAVLDEAAVKLMRRLSLGIVMVGKLVLISIGWRVRAMPIFRQEKKFVLYLTT